MIANDNNNPITNDNNKPLTNVSIEMQLIIIEMMYNDNYTDDKMIVEIS